MRRGGKGRLDRLLVANLGFPREIYIDYDPEFIGDELDLRLTGVTRLDAAG